MRVRVYLAGRAGIALDERLIAGEGQMRGRQSRVAFAYLALNRERLVTREEIAEALWPDEMPATWNAALMTILSRLRSLLARVTPAEAGVRVLGGTAGYQLCLPPDAWLDVDAAALCVDEAEAALRAGRLGKAFGPGVVATSICRRPFLAGHTGPWVESQRARLDRLLLRGLDCLSHVWIHSEEPALAVEAAMEAVRVDPFRESSYVLLMKAHQAAGNRADALRVYRDLLRLLQEELDAAPAPETEQCYLQIRG